jgi:crossover junction endodeoxyribonuclease RuvC
LSVESHVILGLDPGIALLGYGVVGCERGQLTYLAHGCVETKAGLPLPLRLRQLFDGVIDLKQRYPVTDVAMESLFHSRNVSTAIIVGEARGVAMLAAVDGSIVLGEYTPTQVKQVVTGYGGARKRQIQEMVTLRLGLSSIPKPDDAADALAIAICHAQQLDLQLLVARASQDPTPV